MSNHADTLLTPGEADLARTPAEITRGWPNSNTVVKELGLDATPYAKRVQLWAFCLEIGDYLVLQIKLDEAKLEVQDLDDPALTTAFGYFSAIAEQALAYEAAHGKGCLRNESHAYWPAFHRFSTHLRKIRAGWAEAIRQGAAHGAS